MDIKLVNKFNKNQAELAQVEAQIINATAALQKQRNNLQKQDAEFREQLKEVMEKTGTKKFESDLVTITLVAATTRKGVDLKKLEAEHPKIYAKCQKVTPVSSSIRIKVHEQ